MQLNSQPDDHAPDHPGNDAHDIVGPATGAALLVGKTGTAALAMAALLVGLALVFTCGTVGILSADRPRRRAMRQLAIGAGAAGATYLLGLVLGATVG